MMWRLRSCGELTLILGAGLWVTPISGWAGAPRKTPDEARLREAAEAPENRAEETALSRVEQLTEHYGRLYDTGKYEEAISVAKEACAIIRKELGRRSGKYAICLNDLAVLYQDQGEYGRAESMLKRALFIIEAESGPDHLDVALGFGNLATLYYVQGAFVKAEPLMRHVLTLREKALGPDHPDVATSLDNLSVLYNAQGEFEKAEPLYERALSIRENALGPEHPDVARSLNNMATLYYAQGEYEKAEPLYGRALAINEKMLGFDHPDVAGSLNNMAALYDAQGKYWKAKPLYEQALAINERTLGSGHPRVASYLNNLALLYEAQGEYGKAELLHERALAIREKVLGPDHPDVAGSLNNLAVLYQKQGEYGRAEPLVERTLDIWEKTLGARHQHVALSLANLAYLYQMRGEYGEAEPLHERALAIREKVLGPDHPDVAGSLNNLAMLYQTQKEYVKAQPLYERAVAIREKALGPEHPLVALSFHNLASVYDDQGDRERAEPFYRQALAIWEKALGPSYHDVAKSLYRLGSLHLELGRYDSAVELRGKAMDIQYDQLSSTLLFAEEYRRLDFAATLNRTIENVISAHLQAAPDHHPSAELALLTLLRRKGLVLDLGARSANTIRRSLPEEQYHLFDDLSMTRNRYAMLTNRGPGPLSIERFAEQLAEIQREQHRLWQEIGEHSPIVEALSKPVTFADVQRVLPSKSVLVEYVRYFPKYYEKSPSASAAPRYAAYLLFPDRFDWVDLGPAEPIEEYVKAFRKALQLKHAVPTDLHDAVMQPIVERLSDARRLFIAPDADLNLVPFGALYNGKQHLVERYDLYYLTTGRDLLRPWDASPSTDDDTVMVVANPTDASLPGTEREAELLEGLFPHVETLLHGAATEAGAQHRTQPWVLHLATHGFFEVPKPDPKFEAGMDEYVLSMSPGALPFHPGRLDNPMLHSGLLLASADTPAEATAGADVDDEHITTDGRLTAYEISGWDLRGTELVVLSACGTGLGEPRAGEGVLGLRRAFAMAGAQTQVMSLWDVSDATTAKLMEAYYRKLLAGKGRAEAMQEVQLEMLRSGEHHPGDWASFVVVGEWRPLSKERLPTGPEGPPPLEAGGCGCQRASIGGDGQPPALLLLGLLVLVRRGSGLWAVTQPL